MAKKTIKGTGTEYTGTSKADTITVKGKKNTVSGAKGNDTIILSSGTGHTFYGKAGNDTFVITEDSTGTAVVKDYGTSKGNKDKLKISGGVVKSIVTSGNNLKFTGGKSASITLQANTKKRTVLITDSRGSWKVGSNTITLGKDFNGTMDVRKYLTTYSKLIIDASAVAKSIDIIGSKVTNEIYLGKADGGTCQGMAGDDKILLSAGSYHTVYGDDEANKLTGKDTIMVQTGSGHKLYGGKGKDIIYLFSGAGDGSTLEGGAGNDQIAIERDAGSNHTVKGGAGADQIYIDGGWHRINGGAGGDVITLGANLQKDVTAAVEDGNYVYGDSGADTITVSSGNSHHINTGSGADRVEVNSGKGHYIYNDGGGNDVITIGSSAGDGIYIYGCDNDASCENVTISGGNGHNVWLYEGNDTITVSSSGTGHKIHSNEGNDVISVTGGYSHEISGGDGADNITLNNVKGNGDGYSVYNPTRTSVFAGDGADTITVTNSSDVRIHGENGIDTINVSNSSGVYVEPYGDCGKVAVESCKDTYILLTSTTGNNVNTVTVKGTANDVTIEQYPNAIDDITVNWSDGFGKLTIKASRLGDSEQYVDTLNIKADMSNFNFYKRGSDLIIAGKNGGEIYISGFSVDDNWTSFINGINFSDGKAFAYRDFSNLSSK